MSTALITGASSGIGRELARAFARRGYDLILTARGRERLETAAEELRDAYGRRVTTVQVDLATVEGPQLLVDALVEGDHAVDVLVNNAGVPTRGRFDRLPLEDELAALRLNAVAVTWLTRVLLPGMVSRDGGGLLNVASTAAFQPGPGMAVYYASKAYVLRFSEALAEELRGTGVTVTALCPGPTRSEFQRRAQMEETRLHRLVPMEDPAPVAEAGVRAFERGRRMFVPGRRNRMGVFATRLLPRDVLTRLVAWLHGSHAGGDAPR